MHLCTCTLYSTCTCMCMHNTTRACTYIEWFGLINYCIHVHVHVHVHSHLHVHVHVQSTMYTLHVHTVHVPWAACWLVYMYNLHVHVYIFCAETQPTGQNSWLLLDSAAQWLAAQTSCLWSWVLFPAHFSQILFSPHEHLSVKQH